MLVDSAHTRWIVVTVGLAAAATAVYVPYHVRSINGPSGGSWIGLSFGIAAFGLMLFAGLLGARRRVPTWRVGRPQSWMRGHLWLGLLIVPLAFFHGGFQFGGALTLTLMVLLLLVTASGIVGVILQQILPRMMTLRVPMETIREEIPHVRAQLVEEADAIVKKKLGEPGEASAEARGVVGAAPVREFYGDTIRPFLDAETSRGPLATASVAAFRFSSVRPLADPSLHEMLDDLRALCEERRQLALQVRLHAWLHGWLLVHVPLSYGLLLLSGIHAVVSVGY